MSEEDAECNKAVLSTQSKVVYCSSEFVAGYTYNDNPKFLAQGATISIQEMNLQI